jgi:hypothetical protein
MLNSCCEFRKEMKNEKLVSDCLANMLIESGHLASQLIAVIDNHLALNRKVEAHFEFRSQLSTVY